MLRLSEAERWALWISEPKVQTNLSQNFVCFDESFNLNKINLDAKPCYDNNHVYRIDFLENDKEAMNFNFDSFMPKKPKFKINSKNKIHAIVNNSMLYFYNLIIIVGVDAYVYHKFCKSRSCQYS